MSGAPGQKKPGRSLGRFPFHQLADRGFCTNKNICQFREIPVRRVWIPSAQRPTSQSCSPIIPRCPSSWLDLCRDSRGFNTLEGIKAWGSPNGPGEAKPNRYRPAYTLRRIHRECELGGMSAPQNKLQKPAQGLVFRSDRSCCHNGDWTFQTHISR
jgi:hypothetical protein